MSCIPSADAQEIVSTASLYRGRHTLRNTFSYARVAFLSISWVPQGYQRGGCGVPTLYVKREERGIVPASRMRHEFFEVGVQRRDG